MTLSDIAVTLGVVVIIPFLYVLLPVWVVCGFMAFVVLCVLPTVADPLLRPPWAPWLAALLLVVADLGTNWQFGGTSPLFLLVNDAVLVLACVGVANLWVQGGMKARDVTVLAGGLAVYDLAATSWLPLTSDLLHRLAASPLVPLVAWGHGNAELGIGLGDLLLVTVFPLVMLKAYGRTAGLTGVGVSLAVIAVLAVALQLAARHLDIPLMTVLGPVMVLQYLAWSARHGEERTTWQYLRADSRPQGARGERDA